MEPWISGAHQIHVNEANEAHAESLVVLRDSSSAKTKAAFRQCRK